MRVPEFVQGRLTPCPRCGESGTWGGGYCNACRRLYESDQRLPHREILRRMAAPEGYREPYAWTEGERLPCEPLWPTGARCLEWPAQAAEGAATSPWCITLSGVNGSGKSVLAARMLVELWRLGYRPVGRMPCWIQDGELHREEAQAGYGDPRPLREAAALSPVLTWDDFGSGGSPGEFLDLIERRHAKRWPTIFTVHGPVSKARAARHGMPGTSIEELAPAVYSRLTTGWGGRWMAKTWRGSAERYEG